MHGGSEIVFLARTGRQKMVEEWQSADIPNDFLYGFAEVLNSGRKARVQEMKHPGGIRQWLDHWIKCASQWSCRQNLPIFTILNSVWMDRGKSVVYFTNIDSISICYGVLKSLGLVDAPIVHISQGLSNELESFPERNRVRWTTPWIAFILKQIDVLAVLGKGAKTALIQCFSFNQHRVHYLPFGIDDLFWTEDRQASDREDSGFILTVGSDGQRDYSTLRKASLPLPLKLLTRIPLGTVPSGWEVLPEQSFQQIRELYQRATLTVIPVKDVSQPSGQSSALQAMACGCPVILSDFRGVWDPARLIDHEVVVFARVGCSVDLERKVEELVNDEALRKTLSVNASKLVKAHYGSKKMGRRLLQYCDCVDPRMQLMV